MSRIDEAMRSVVREDFLPDGQKGSAGFDAALPIGGGSTCSQPTTVRNMLELLDPCPGDSVLDVGSGSGWTTAILAELVGDGTVTGVELLPDLVERSRETLRGRAVDNATIVQATEGVLGHPEGSPYDRILVSADAEGSVPQELIDQLADGGVLVCPVDGMMTRVEKSAGGTGMVEVSEHGLYRFVPLVVRDH
ncbi:MAG TPA: protein-L-isoaspartate O-methyltransferase [Candidatus Corynebacterium avicola]|uniref:Protein-L-isoaspartate O-methyltransferase n=1 Tax=Candidatus Corynebacterium avicola TaxID=2838527 RepID=A0A9D1RT49_9CORY|nr:protein-L-isoaspartate O-methyltransferase [Candidatus Corynebacterium avicola]